MSQLAQSVPIAHATTPVVIRAENFFQRLLRGAWMDVLKVKERTDIVWLRAL